jgi:transcriptional regulator with XRE-family HTH domain
MLGEKIKIFIKANGIKQTFLANKLGVSNSTLNAMLNGNRNITAEEYFKICQTLNVSVETFREKN